MRKSFLLMAAMLLMGSSVFAGGGYDFSIGPKIGYQTARLSYQRDDIKAGFANHFTVGLFGRIEFGRFYVQPEVLWFKSQSVFDLTTNVEQETIVDNITIPNGANMTFTLNAMNIQVPFLVGFKHTVVNNLLAIRVQAGPTLNFTIPQKTLLNENVGNSNPIELDNDTFDTQNIAFGFQGGLGLDVLKRITLDVNYNFGITKAFGADAINNTEWGQYVNTNNISDAHTNLFMVTIGYKFL
jgi:opacity protein-like surface antigen